MSSCARQAANSLTLEMPCNAKARHAKATARRGMPTQGKACCHVKLPIASLSKCLAMPRPSQGKACQRKARHAKAHANARQGMPRPRQGMPRPRQGMPRPRHAKAKARHAEAKACQGHGTPRPSTTCQRKARHVKAKACKATPCQCQGTTCQSKPRPRHAKLPIASLSRNALNGAMPMPRHAKAKARHANASQGHAMPSFQ
ncbi:hypothetical protein L3X38_027518 [Prunus dulcis]|uniref:Uncharacterized protein n=1 Tax=Prunus dulcis TaxID=3755 RepID=A0AAD4VPZ1_PRUDU|nr:hypothetical protein L3X38_027518 [Prunus dulcis]